MDKIIKLFLFMSCITSVCPPKSSGDEEIQHTLMGTLPGAYVTVRTLAGEVLWSCEMPVGSKRENFDRYVKDKFSREFGEREFYEKGHSRFSPSKLDEFTLQSAAEPVEPVRGAKIEYHAIPKTYHNIPDLMWVDHAEKFKLSCGYIWEQADTKRTIELTFIIRPEEARNGIDYEHYKGDQIINGMRSLRHVFNVSSGYEVCFRSNNLRIKCESKGEDIVQDFDTMFTDLVVLGTELEKVRQMPDDDMEEKIRFGIQKCEEFCAEYPMVKEIYCPIEKEITPIGQYVLWTPKHPSI